MTSALTRSCPEILSDGHVAMKTENLDHHAMNRDVKFGHDLSEHDAYILRSYSYLNFEETR